MTNRVDVLPDDHELEADHPSRVAARQSIAARKLPEARAALAAAMERTKPTR